MRKAPKTWQRCHPFGPPSHVRPAEQVERADFRKGYVAVDKYIRDSWLRSTEIVVMGRGWNPSCSDYQRQEAIKRRAAGETLASIAPRTSAADEPDLIFGRSSARYEHFRF